MWVTKNGYEIHQVLKGRSNSFLVIKDNKALIVDTGRRSKRRTLAEGIDFYPNLKLVALILTHSHFDHAENAAYLKEKYHLKVFIQSEESDFLRKGENPPIRGAFLITRLLTNLWESKIRTHFRYEPVEPDFLVNQRFDLNDFGFNCYMLHTPGHSQGSMCLIVDNEIAIVGDAMFGVIKKLIYPPFAYDSGQMVESWGKLLDTGCHTFLPGHGTQNSRSLIQNQYEKFRNPQSKA
jgi:glyoxylase-like metal-dependent hydrolase (beta-lactamase superfamily II)